MTRIMSALIINVRGADRVQRETPAETKAKRKRKCQMPNANQLGREQNMHSEPELETRKNPAGEHGWKFKRIKISSNKKRREQVQK